MANPEFDRRISDSKFDTIIDRLDTLEVGQKDIASKQADHVEKDHGNITGPEAKALVAEHKGMIHDVGLTVDLIAGKPIIDVYTGVPTGQREPGIADRVKLLEYNSNGGRGFSVRNRDKIIIAGMSASAILLAEVIRQLWG